MFKLAAADNLLFIKKHPFTFILFIVGLLTVSFLSILLSDNLRYEFLSSAIPSGKTGFLVYRYDEPQSGAEILKELKSCGTGSYDLYLVTESADKNNPLMYSYITDILGFSGIDTWSSDKLTYSGVVGYSRSVYYIRKMIMQDGRWLGNEDKGKTNAVIRGALSTLLNDDGTITADGLTFKVVGTVSTEEEYSIAFADRNLVTTPETFAEAGLKAKIVFLVFYISPTKGFLEKITGKLNAIGENANTAEYTATIGIDFFFSFLKTAFLYIGALALLFSVLLLIFKCQVAAQQSVYTVYSLCGITDRKAALLRKAQLFFCVVPVYALCTAGYILLTLNNYKKYVYSISPELIAVNFLLIITAAFIMSDIQNRKNKGFNAVSMI